MIEISEVWQVIARAWSKDRVRFAWMIIGLLASNPVLLFQMVIVLLEFSWTSLALLLIGIGLGHLAINIGVITGRLRDAAHVLFASQQIKNAGIHGYTISAKHALQIVNTFPYDIGDDIERWFFQMGGLNSFPLDYHIRIYVVPGSGGFTTYTSGPGLPSRVFLSNHPRKGLRHAFQKFYLLHEILHAAAEIRYSALERFSLTIFGLLILWALPITPWNSVTTVAAVVTACSMIFLWYRSRSSANVHPVSREIWADAFAIGYLDAEERRWIHDAVQKSSVRVLRDDALSSSENAERLAAFVRHLQKDDDALLRDTIATKPWRTQWSEVPFLLGIAVLAGCSSGQGGWFLFGASIALVLSYFVFVALISAQAQLNAQIDNELASIMPSNEASQFG